MNRTGFYGCTCGLAVGGGDHNESCVLGPPTVIPRDVIPQTATPHYAPVASAAAFDWDLDSVWRRAGFPNDVSRKWSNLPTAVQERYGTIGNYEEVLRVRDLFGEDAAAQVRAAQVAAAQAAAAQAAAAQAAAEAAAPAAAPAA